MWSNEEPWHYPGQCIDGLIKVYQDISLSYWFHIDCHIDYQFYFLLYDGGWKRKRFHLCVS